MRATSIMLAAICLVATTETAGQNSGEDDPTRRVLDELQARYDRATAAESPDPAIKALLYDPGARLSRPVTLESLLKNRPLILAFGSYT